MPTNSLCESYIPAVLIVSSIACSALATANISTDKAALLTLKASINYPQTTLASNWSAATSPCEWIGVTCSSIHHRVTSLNLSNMALTGTLPPQLGNLSFLHTLDLSTNNFHGKLPPDLVRLRRLRFVRLLLNKFSGEIPPWFGLLQDLRYLNLRNNSFTGSLPVSLTDVSSLEFLDLSANPLEGMIPEEFGSFRNIKTLSTQYNNLVGPIPSAMFNMSSLEILALSKNSLSGTLPIDICKNLQNLTSLYLTSNRLGGEIPPSLFQCSRLQLLSLGYNNFVGAIPREIGLLENLQVLSLGGNNISGAIPQEIGNLKRLTFLAMEENRISGSLPRTLFNLVSLQTLVFASNQLTGIIPREIGRLPMLQSLELSSNRFTGVIPEEVANLSHLVELSLEYNDLSGSIPVGIFNISSLTNIILQYNHLSGVLPSTMGHGLPNLQILQLDGNNFRGVDPTSNSGFSHPPELSFITSLTSCRNLLRATITNNPLNGALPGTIGQMSTDLNYFSAVNCQIKGRIPDEIGNLSSLNTLYLSGNELIGTIPTTVGDLTNIQQLQFDMNQLTGSIPSSFCKLQHLGLLSLSDNQLSGSIPMCLDNVTALRLLYLDSNRLTSSIPSSLFGLTDLLELSLSSNYLTGSLPLEISDLKVVRFLNMSFNNFSGNVPSIFGALQDLVYLSLAGNNLQGPIPESIGSCVSLEGLDLSHNNLSGAIPKSFENLEYLIFLNVSFNDLDGEIPSGGPFKNFTSDSFLPNGALCGDDPKFHVPPCGLNSGRKSRRRNRVVLYTLLSIAAMLLSLAFVSLLYIFCQKNKRRSSVLGLTEELRAQRKKFSYYEIQQATEGYGDHNVVGKGGLGTVYKGTLRDGTVIAVKVFNLQVENAFRSFDTECEVLRNLRHRNLTKVISTCSNEDFKALVLEYMPNGSLDKWLYSENHCLDIVQRLDIIIDVAHGLEYLHHGYDVPVVHCDLKPSNVLLDASMVAHLSDFGIAKLLGEGDSFSLTKTLATFGYIAPEYGLDGLVSSKCDVYSFGILLMETFTRRKPSDEMFEGDLSLKQWISDSIPESIIQVADPNLLRLDGGPHSESLQCLKSIMELALHCSQERPGDRPNIKDTVAALEFIKRRLLAIMQSN